MPEIALVPDEANLAKALPNAAAPDLQLKDADDPTKAVVGFIRRKLPSTDVYLVVNTSNKPLTLTATFATTHKNAEEWDVDSGAVSPATATGQSVILDAYASRVYVFTDAPHTPGLATVPGHAIPMNIANGWDVTFTGIDKTVQMLAPTDWTADPSTLHYSGEAIYTRDFNLPAPYGDKPVFLQILGGQPMPTPARAAHTYAFYNPPIQAAALVSINGQPVGALWHPPYWLDITKQLKVGMNHIEIRVYNTAQNAWSALPPHDYRPLIAKYGDRFQMQDLNLVAPVPSGLLGNANLVFTVDVEDKKKDDKK